MNYMRKAVAVPYIIAILLGIAVIGLVGYWFFVSTGRLGGAATLTDCQNKEVQYCSQWLRTGVKPLSWNLYAKGCTEVGVADPDKARCNQKSATGLPSGSTCSDDNV